MMKRIAALVPNILGVSPGQRVRIESWAEYLREAGWTIDFYPFEDAGLHKLIYEPGHAAGKAKGLLQCYVRQLKLMLRRPPCDVLFIFREAALVGPAFIERLGRRLRVPIIYDLDDPVFVPYRSPTNGWFSLLKFPRKTYSLFRLSDHVIAINNLIAEHARGYNPAVSVIPNCVDIVRYQPKPKDAGQPVRLVWMGSHSTMPNLETIRGPLQRLQQADDVPPLRVIGAGEAALPGVRVEMRQWSAETEVADLQDCDVGLVPLTDMVWNPWKFFYKTVQYMAVGLPVVARKLGSNAEVIEHGVSGFLVETDDEWYEAMRALLTNRDLRRRMGEAARERVVTLYSTQSQMPNMVRVFEQVLEKGRPAAVDSLRR